MNTFQNQLGMCKLQNGLAFGLSTIKYRIHILKIYAMI